MKKYTERIIVRLTPEQYKILTALADSEGVSLSEAIRLVIEGATL